ncbi:MAG: hypothetical protein WB626_04685 [Bacteroidota bacterium]
MQHFRAALVDRTLWCRTSRALFRNLLPGESGATMIEEIMVVGLIVLPLAFLGNILLDILKDYFRLMAVVVSVPFP